MLNNVLVLCALTGICYGAWPLIMRVCQFGPAMSLLVLNTTGWICGFILYYKNPPLDSEMEIKKIVIGLVAGSLNAIGTVFYTKLIGMNNAEFSKFIPISFVLSLTVAVIGGWMIYSELMTFKKALGLIAAIITIFLLK